MKMQVLVVFLACFAAFGGFMFGYDIGVINGVKDMDGFRRTMNLSLVKDEQSNGSLNCGGTDTNENALLGLVVSLFSIGCFIGALVSGGTLQIIILIMIVPVYNAELAPKTLRGRLVSLNQLFITAGIMVSFCVSVAVHTVDFGWRIALGLQCVLAVVLIIGMIFLPETPRWLVKKGKSKKADKTLHRLRKDYTEEEIKEELNDIEFTVQNSNNSLRDIFADVFRWRILKRPVVWVVTSEVFPLSVRVTTSGNWIGNFVVAMVTPLLLGSVLKTAGTFYILAGFLFASFLFVLLTLPETKGESLERIDELFLRPWLQRMNLFYYLRCCCPWSNACRVRTAQEEDTVAIVGIKNENKDDTSDEAEDDENESLIKDTDVLESSLSAKFDK
uniref:Major facilitator superfamily (MFS) profile domain-containing protein n=1 Tax=Amphimedon queenslandica TaxID=400682 RepID=A0A1X7TTS5_AMPQE